MTLRLIFKISPKCDRVKVEITDQSGIGLSLFNVSIPDFIIAVSSAQTVLNVLKATGRLKE